MKKYTDIAAGKGSDSSPKGSDPSPALLEALRSKFPQDRLKYRLIDRHAYSSDASFYSLLPAVIVFPVSVEEIQFLFRLAADHHTSITFRTAGTSLSGQAVTNGILADLSRHWPLVGVENNGLSVRVEPGVTGHRVNHMLKPYGRKIGPDPASINSAMMGGILSNNSSGMCCGVTNNSYHSLEHIKFVLPDGGCYDTSDKDDYWRFEQERPHIFRGILELRRKIAEDEVLADRIRSKYKMKNTVGYSLNAFPDFEHPLDILAHLLIGAEGTLAFIAQAVLCTIPDKPFKRTGLLFFPSAKAACNAIPALKNSGAEALEFMDRAAIRSIENMPDAPVFLKVLPDEAACILCEYQDIAEMALDVKLKEAESCLAAIELIYPAAFTDDPALQADYWKLRKGMYPSVAAVRAKGSSVMLEDIAVPVDRLGEAIEDLQALFLRYRYHDAIVFGHAKEGNLHFLVSQSIASENDIRQFGAFNDELADLVIHRYGGALKAEHGTGRQIAPYVEAEWGGLAYSIMKDLKTLIDPRHILNPGVIINADKDCHLKDLKSLPVVEEEVDKCVECGYCEHLCPSRHYTLTPRQRIVLRRSLARLKEAGDHAAHRTLLRDYRHDGIDTCAVDGLCATGCPVHINTGELVKRLRKENHSVLANRFARQVARHFGIVERIAKTGLRMGIFINKVAGRHAMYKMTSAIRRILPAFPLWSSQLMGPPVIQGNMQKGMTGRENDLNESEQTGIDNIQVIYFVTCINRVMGKDKEKKDSIIAVAQRLAAKAGIRLFIASDLKGYCCGQPFSSKGFIPAFKHTVNRTIAQLWEWSQEGRIPVMVDISSCTFTLQQCRPYLDPENQKKFDRLTIRDSLDFATDILLPRLIIRKKADKAVFHPVCSLQKMGLHQKLIDLGKQTADHSLIPFAAGCCGMAGDRGFYYPGLIQAASREEVEEVNEWQGGGHYSTGKTCEMAMSENSGKAYRSIFYLLDEVSEQIGRTMGRTTGTD